jgi:hypothetical protein
VVVGTFRETRWKMLGAVALAGVGLLLLAFRYVPAPNHVVDPYSTSQVPATMSVGPSDPTGAMAGGSNQTLTSAAPSPGAPPAASGFVIDPAKSVMIMGAGCGCADNVEVTTTVYPGSAAGTAGTVQVVAHVWLHSYQGGFDYSPAIFKFRAKNKQLYAPVATTAFGPTLATGRLGRGDTTSGVLVFDVPAGAGAIELVDNLNKEVFDWPVKSSK